MSPKAKKILRALKPQRLLKPLIHHHDDKSDTSSPLEDDTLSTTDQVSVASADDLTSRTASMRSEMSQGVDESSIEKASGEDDLSGIFNDGVEIENGGDPSPNVLAPLKGGVLVDELYGVTPKELNRIIYAQDSKMAEEMRTRKGVTDAHVGSWARSQEEGVFAERVVDYLTAPSKLVKSCRAVEYHKYLAATSTCFVVHQTTVAKDLPMGDSFTTEVKFCITQERKPGLSEGNAGQDSPKTPTSVGAFPNSPKHARASTLSEGSRTSRTSNLSDSPRTPQASDLSDGGSQSRGKSSPSILALSKVTSPEQESPGMTSSEAESQTPTGEASSKRVDTPGSTNPQDGVSSKSLDGGGTAVTRLQISYEPKFLKSTIMKGMIEKGMSQGLKETYATFVEILANYAPHMDKDALAAEKRALTSSSQKGDASRKGRGSRLELLPSDLSDDGQDVDAFVDSALDEVVTSGAILIVLLAAHRFLDYLFGVHSQEAVSRNLKFWLTLSTAVRVWEGLWAVGITTIVLMMMSRLLDLLRHGVSMVVGDNSGPAAVGSGWQLSVAVLEAQNLPMMDENGLKRDPFVMLGCGGQSRSSSVKLQGQDTRWNEVLQFDPMDTCPRYLAIAVEDYEGPFSDAQTIGIAEVDFLKYTTEGLNDLWVYLEGEKVRGSGARLHLKIALSNENSSEVGTRTRQLARIVEQETGKKIKANRSQYSGPFHRLFSLPEHEILIDNFACQLKKKKGPNAGGRIFMSPNLLAFYSSMFGTKTAFTLVWGDIEEIKERNTPKALMALQTVLFPHVKIYLKATATPEAIKHASSVDKAGRHVFRFENFVHPGNAFRTMKLLHRQHALAEQDREEVRDVTSTYVDEEEFLSMEEPEMTLALEMEVPFTPEAFLEIMRDSNLDQQVAIALGWQDYRASEWEPVEDAEQKGAMRRQVSYKYPHRHHGNAELHAFVLQQKWAEPDLHQLGLNEIATLHGAAFGDHFQVQGRKLLRLKDSGTSTLQSFVGVTFHKGTALQDKIVKSVLEAAKRDAREHGEVLAATVMATVQGMRKR